MTYVKVALAVPVDGLFDYAWIDRGKPRLGTVVSVPFGRRQLTGVVLAIDAQPEVEPTRIKPVSQVLSAIAPLDTDTIELIHFCSWYYHHPIGEVALDVLPLRTARARRVRRVRPWRR